MDQYYKWKQLNSNFTEEEIASRIFREKYLNPTGRDPESENNKTQRYLDSGFYPQNVLELCLISLDIEQNMNPGSDQNFNKIADFVKTMMIEYDYYNAPTLSGENIEKDKISSVNFSYKVTDFVGRWYDNFL